VTDQVIKDHLQGRHVVGVYPLLKDESCAFLAIDFDGKSWTDDVSSILETSNKLGMTPAVERSRSGKGAHVWFFFEESVSAASARKMGCYLITRTMAQRHQMSMTSYDRLFPSQDTMPRGGFGNLIALPLQYEARRAGNTVFVDSSWTPHDDQWDYLASLDRLPRSRVEALAEMASQEGRIIGVQLPPSSEETETTRSQEGPRIVSIEDPLPKWVRVDLGREVLVAKSGLPSPLFNQIKRLAAFQNPEFYKRQSLRLSTALTPRVITCAEDLPEAVALPRGCLLDLEELLRTLDISLRIEDQRTAGQPIDVAFQGKLTTLQKRAVEAMSEFDIGVFVAPPGMGKTVVGAHLIADRKRSTLVLVHRTQLLDQWREQLAVFLDLEVKEIGQIGGGRRKQTGLVDVAMIQSLARRKDLTEIVGSYGNVIVDECHHVPAVSFESVLKEVSAKYITGLTATPIRRDGHHPILHYYLGPIRYSIDRKSQAARESFRHRLFVRETSFSLEAGESAKIQHVYQRLAQDSKRNEMILDDVIRALEDGRSPLVLTERRDHLQFLADQLEGMTANLVVLQGGMGTRKRREALERLASLSDDEERLVISTGRFAGEGFDDPRLDTLFLTMPVSWRGTLVQYAGRLHRTYRKKSDVHIFDYADFKVPMLERMFQKRMKGYAAMGYEVADSDEASADQPNELTLEYDQEALRDFGRSI
jgi:superfamily II DNA or RNA helicase